MAKRTIHMVEGTAEEMLGEAREPNTDLVRSKVRNC